VLRTPLFGILVASSTLAACAARPSCPTPAPVALPVMPPAEGAALPPQAAGRTTPWARSSPCFARGRPAPPPATKEVETPFCSGFDAQELARVEARIRKDFVRYEKPSKLVVDFGCDAAYGTARELVYESGSGHGGSLRILRFRWETDGRVAIRRIESSHYFDRRVAIAEAETATARIDPVLAKARVAMLARPHVVRLEWKNGGIGMSFSFSSNDFHLLVRIADQENRVTERRFTGYESSADQESFLPLRLATKPLDELIASVQFVRAEVTDDDRAFFTARLLATLAGKPAWWIKERYVELAAVLGTKDAVPPLVAIAQQSGDASAERAREAALESITHITGWDPRVDPKGRPRSIDEAARAAREECAL
jgi:hypothetical protein